MHEEKDSRPAESEVPENQPPQNEPLTDQVIAKEAKRIMTALQYAQPEKHAGEWHVPVRVSPEFMRKAKLPNMDQLQEHIPVEGASFSTFKGRSGLYVVFPADEARAAVAEQRPLTDEEVNAVLFDRMSFEQADYKNWLLSQPPEEILNHTVEYTVRNDILLSLEYNDLSREKAEALLRSPCALADVYHNFQNRDTGYMNDLLDCITDSADRAIKREQERSESAGQQRNGTAGNQQREAAGAAAITEERKPSVLKMLHEKPETPAAVKPPDPNRARISAR